jgi:hypothetical protein
MTLICFSSDEAKTHFPSLDAIRRFTVLLMLASARDAISSPFFAFADSSSLSYFAAYLECATIKTIKNCYEYFRLTIIIVIIVDIIKLKKRTHHLSQ